MADLRKRTCTASIVTLDDWSDDYNANLYAAYADENTDPIEPLDVTLMRHHRRGGPATLFEDAWARYRRSDRCADGSD